MTKATQAAQNIINAIEVALAAHCVSCPAIMMGCILDNAQELVSEDGYQWDVALAMACKIYPATTYCGQAAYGA